MEKFAREIAERIEADLFRTICGPQPKRRETALRTTGYGFEVVELDDAGKIIEPCRKCGPVLLCPEHMAWIT